MTGLLYALAVALSAFLLFLVQPIAARSILTWFGGAPAVWTTCLVFFQGMLLFGYVYAHVLSSRSPRARLVIHGTLLLIAMAIFLPLDAAEDWKPNGDESPVPRILGFLVATVGLPYFALSATSPLVQRMAAEIAPGKDPYRLTALSNAASLAGLLVYPFVLEPMVALNDQRSSWSLGFIAFVVAMGLALIIAGRKSSVPAIVPPPCESRIDSGVMAGVRHGFFTWLALAMFPSMMLAAVTNELCTEVAAVPFLWVAPLAIYLVTFIIAFEYPRIYVRQVFGALLLLSSLGISVLRALGGHLSLPIQIVGYCAALFFCCMACHAEVARARPEPSQLTRFHLTLALGGVLGSGFVALVAPVIFDAYHELYLAIGGCCIALLLTWLRSGKPVLYVHDPLADRVALLLWVIGLAMTFWSETWAKTGNVLRTHRDFHGMVSVIRDDSGTEPFDFLRHGRTQHGAQLVAPARRRELTSYYSEGSGFYLGVLNHAKRQQGEPMRFGVIGLGIGVIAAFGAKGDVIRFYELVPAVEDIARENFSFLADSAAKVEVVLGDARLSLERELARGEPQQFDILAVDAFSSDSIPRHLITREAFDLYLKHLAPGGVLSVQVSNRYLDLKPLVKALADDRGLASVLVISRQPVRANPRDRELWRTDNTWVLMSRDRSVFETPGWSGKVTPWPSDLEVLEPWTDDFGGLFSIVKW